MYVPIWPLYDITYKYTGAGIITYSFNVNSGRLKDEAIELAKEVGKVAAVGALAALAVVLGLPEETFTQVLEGI